jgi:HK97 family phage major capsid protein
MVDDAVKTAVESTVEKKLEKVEDVEKKSVKGTGEKSQGQHIEVLSDYESLGKERFMIKQMVALKSGDKALFRSLNSQAVETQVKSGYMNETTDADGGYLVPPADFIADVVRLEEEYGVAARNAKLYTTRSNAVTLNKKSSSVTMYKVGEAAAKTGTKMGFGQETITLEKYAAIAATTDELIQDSPVNAYNELVRDFARENARIQDTLVFTDATTGIVHQSGVNIVSIGSALSSLTFDHLNQAVFNVPTPSMRNGKFYFNRTILGTLQRIKDLENNYIWKPGPDGPVSGTIWNYPYELVEVMNDVSDDGNNKPFIVFGDLQYTYLIQKSGLQFTQLTEGTVHDADGNAINLAEQDMTALRAVQRMNAKTFIPAAYSVIGTGTVS